MVQKEVKTRKITNIRAHGQKFLLKIVKDMEVNPEGSQIHSTSKYFHDILTGKSTKMHSKLHKI